MESAAVIPEHSRIGRRPAKRPDPARIAAARDRLTAAGDTIRAWARRHQVDPDTAYKVLQGSRACTTGESHRIAVALGIKDGDA